MTFFEHIDDYKDGSLKGEELRLFEEALRNDADLRAAVDNYDAAKGISEGLLELDVMGVIEGLARGEKEGKTTIFSLRKLLVAASVVGVIVFGWWWMEEKRPVPSINIHAENIDYNELYEVLKSPSLASNMRGEISQPNEKAIVQKANNYCAEGNFNAGRKILLDSINNRHLSQYWITEIFFKYEQIDSAIYYLSYLHYSKFKILSRKKNRIISLKILAAVKKGDDDKARRLCIDLPRRDYEKVYEILGITK